LAGKSLSDFCAEKRSTAAPKFAARRSHFSAGQAVGPLGQSCSWMFSAKACPLAPWTHAGEASIFRYSAQAIRQATCVIHIGLCLRSFNVTCWAGRTVIFSAPLSSTVPAVRETWRHAARAAAADEPSGLITLSSLRRSRRGLGDYRRAASEKRGRFAADGRFGGKCGKGAREGASWVRRSLPDVSSVFDGLNIGLLRNPRSAIHNQMGA